MRARRLVALTAATSLLVAGCGSGGDDTSTATTVRSATTTATTPSTTSDATTTTTGGGAREVACPETAAVEELIGGPVDRTMSSGSTSSADLEGLNLSYRYQGCSYELDDNGQGEVSVTRIVDHDAEGSIFEALLDAREGDFVTDGFEEVTDLGDEAYRVGTELAVLTGEVMALFEVSDADDQPDADLRLELAEALLSEGGGILSETELDCDEIAAMAPVGLGTLESTGSAPATSIVDGVTLETKGCHMTFADGATARVGVAPSAQWDAWVEAERNSGFTVELDQTEVAGNPAFDDGDVLIVNDDPDRPLRITSRGDDLDPDPATLRRQLAELVLKG